MINIWPFNIFKKGADRSLEEVPENFYDLKVKALNGDKEIDLADFKGKHLMVVNVASKCGFTYQYEDLQKLYENNLDKLNILGLPCNQFLNQEPGNGEEIASFCQMNYGVSFPLGEKVDVKGKNQHTLFAWLTDKRRNKKENYKVSWNFNKFLISPEGQLIEHFGSKVKPMDAEILNHIK